MFKQTLLCLCIGFTQQATCAQNYSQPISKQNEVPLEIYIHNASNLWNLRMEYYDLIEQRHVEKIVPAGKIEPLAWTNEIDANISFQAESLLGLQGVYQKHNINLAIAPYKETMLKLQRENAPAALMTTQLLLTIAPTLTSWNINLTPKINILDQLNRFNTKFSKTEEIQAAASSSSEEETPGVMFASKEELAKQFKQQPLKSSDLIELTGIDDFLKTIHLTRIEIERNYEKDKALFNQEDLQKMNNIKAQLKELFFGLVALKNQKTLTRKEATEKLRKLKKSWNALVGAEATENPITKAFVKLCATWSSEPAIEQ